MSFSSCIESPRFRRLADGSKRRGTVREEVST
jgi:hypothetical protein